MAADRLPDPAEAICPGCKRPVSECQAEDVDESFAPVSAAVSPAEPPERDPAAKLRELVEHHEERVAKGRPPYAALWITPEDAEAFLAVGERDRQHIERAVEKAWTVVDANYATSGATIHGKQSLWTAIADLEAALRELSAARAVLADKEETGPIDGHELARRISGGAVERIAQFACGETGCMEIVEVLFDGSPVESPLCPVHATTMLLGGFRAAGEEDT